LPSCLRLSWALARDETHAGEGSCSDLCNKLEIKDIRYSREDREKARV
jgi:hypothetical protein